MATGQVIRYLRRKGSSGFTEPISWLGAEQRFVGALRNSAVNNLEEQYAVGTDSYTEMYEDAQGNYIIEKSFCITDIDASEEVDIQDRTEYYKLITTIYKNTGGVGNYYFEGDDTVFANSVEDAIFGDGSIDYPDEEMLYLINDEIFEWDSNNDLQIHASSGFLNSRKDELYFIKKNETPQLILTKYTTKKYDDNGKLIVRKKVVNALNP